MSKKSAKIDKKRLTLQLNISKRPRAMENLITYSKSSLFSLSESDLTLWGFTRRTWGKIELKFIGISIFASFNCRIWLS